MDRSREERFWAGLAETTKFFMGQANDPHPAGVAERGTRVALLPLPKLVELKLASA